MTEATPIKTCTESLKLLADFWTLTIIEALADGELRYCAIQRTIGNLNPATLTKKLARLESAGLITRRENAETSAVFYTLTKRGLDALPVLNAIRNFSQPAKS